MITLTKSEKAACEVVFQGLLRDFEPRLKTGDGQTNPHDYYVYKALWHRAHGADAVCVVDDPPA
jgi:hypothetical protein